MSGDEGIDIVFHPENDEFCLANNKTRKDKNWFRIAELQDDDQYRHLRRNLDGGGRHAEKREASFEKVRRILEYEVPYVRMMNHNFDEAVLAFTRINTKGVRLKKEDIESAQVAARHSGFIADQVVPFLGSLKHQGFSRLNVMHLFRACTFVAKSGSKNRTPLHQLAPRKVLSAWKRTQHATEQAIGLIRSELGLVNMNILWSGAFLVPVIALCATTTTPNRDARAVVAWLALAALLHRYSSASETWLEQDLRACREDDRIGALLKNLRQLRPSLAAEANDFRGSLNDRSGLLATYIACRHREILDFYSHRPVLLQKTVDRHHIIPRARFPVKLRSTADTIANIAFISDDTNKSIGHSAPEEYLEGIPRRVLESQFGPVDATLWGFDRAEEFWAARRELLAKSFNEFLREALPRRRVGIA